MSGGVGLPVVEPGATPTTAGRIRALDGLRGIAVAAVLLFHTASSPLPGGYLGVDVFFVLSGFLITGILLAQVASAGRVQLGAFWIRRFRRLAPALMLLLFVLAVVRLVVPQQTTSAWRADLLAALTYTTNWWEIAQSGDYFAQFGPVSPVQHTWSLAIEEQFYLLFALFMAFLARRRVNGGPLLTLLLAATALSIGAMTLATTIGATSWAYYGTLPRLQALLIGAMLAVLARAWSEAPWSPLRETAGWVGLLGLAALLSGVLPATFGPMYTLVALCAGGVVWAAVGDGPLAKVLSVRPLVSLGLISYGVYLWHWPIFLWVRSAGPSVIAEGLAFVATIGVAVVSYVAVEKPVRQGRFTRLATRRQWGSLALVMAAILVLILAPARTMPAVPLPTGDRAETDAPQAAAPGERSGQAPDAARPDRGWPPDDTVASRILTNGDSSTLALTLQFPHDRYPGRDVNGSMVLGCGVSALPYFPAEGVLPPPPECATWKEQWRRWSADLEAPVAVVGVSGWDTIDRLSEGQLVAPGNLTFDRSFALSLEEGLRISGRNGEIPVYVIGMPCFAAQNDGLLRNDPLRRERLNWLAAQVVLRVPKAEFVDLAPLTCDQGTTVSKALSRSLYTDGVHWSREGGRAVWTLILQRMQDDGVVNAGAG